MVDLTAKLIDLRSLQGDKNAINCKRNEMEKNCTYKTGISMNIDGQSEAFLCLVRQ